MLFRRKKFAPLSRMLSDENIARIWNRSRKQANIYGALEEINPELHLS
jgi:hypothetical protein